MPLGRSDAVLTGFWVVKNQFAMLSIDMHKSSPWPSFEPIVVDMDSLVPWHMELPQNLEKKANTSHQKWATINTASTKNRSKRRDLVVESQVIAMTILWANCCGYGFLGSLTYGITSKFGKMIDTKNVVDSWLHARSKKLQNFHHQQPISIVPTQINTAFLDISL